MLLALAALALAPSSALAGTEIVEDAPDTVVEEPPPADMERSGKKRGGGRRGGQGERPPEGGPHGEGRHGPGGEGGRPDHLWAHIRPVGLAQVWVTAWDMDEDAVADASGYGDPEDDVGFKLKRFRLGLAGEEKGLDWALVVGLTAPYDGFDEEDGSIEIVDAHVGYRWKGLGVKVGRDEVPFSRDRMISSGEQTFTERGMIAEHIAPGRDLGASVWGERWGAKVTLGVFNSGGDIFGDDNLGKTFLGRVEYSRGDADVYETWGGSRKLSYGLGVGGFMTDDVSTATQAVGADLILRVAGLTVLVDAALADVSPTNSDLAVPGVWAQTTRRGLTGQIGYGLGAFEPAVKVSLYEDSSVGGYTTLLGGVVWHGGMDDRGRDRVRIGAGYVLRMEESAIANDSVRLWAQVRP
ncbi:MAG: porin [Pseudomonadota bacterium]|nr:porin [Pseudomonadota bacterium]